MRLSGDISPIEKTFFRNVVALLVSIIILIKQKQGFGWKKENTWLLALRSFLGTMGVWIYAYVVDHLLLSDSNILMKLSPFFVILFSFIFLKEGISVIQMTSIVMAFIGALFIIRPSMHFEASLPAIMGVMGALVAGAAYTCLRLLGLRGENPAVIVFFFSAFSTIVSLPFVFTKWHPISIYQFTMLIMVGVFASIGQFGITFAYHAAPAREISIFDYTQIIFAAMLELIFFHTLPSSYSLIGYVIIFSAAFLSFYFGKKEG